MVKSTTRVGSDRVESRGKTEMRITIKKETRKYRIEVTKRPTFISLFRSVLQLCLSWHSVKFDVLLSIRVDLVSLSIALSRHFSDFAPRFRENRIVGDRKDDDQSRCPSNDPLMKSARRHRGIIVTLTSTEKRHPAEQRRRRTKCQRKNRIINNNQMTLTTKTRSLN